MILCKGGTSIIAEPTLGERVMRETCVTFPSGHVKIMHEQRILGSAEVASRHTSGLQTLYLHFIERVDGIFSGDGRRR